MNVRDELKQNLISLSVPKALEEDSTSEDESDEEKTNISIESKDNNPNDYIKPQKKIKNMIK